MTFAEVCTQYGFVAGRNGIENHRAVRKAVEAYVAENDPIYMFRLHDRLAKVTGNSTAMYLMPNNFAGSPVKRVRIIDLLMELYGPDVSKVNYVGNVVGRSTRMMLFYIDIEKARSFVGRHSRRDKKGIIYTE